MSKFRKILPDKKPWDHKLSEIVNREVVVHDFEEVNTGYGPGFIGLTDFVDENGEQFTQARVLFSGQVIYEQVTDFLAQPYPRAEKFPCELKVIYIRGGQYRGYYSIDPDEE